MTTERIDRVARAIHNERANQLLFRRLPNHVPLPNIDVALARAALSAIDGYEAERVAEERGAFLREAKRKGWV